MTKFRIGDLRSYMKRTHSSPEAVSKKIPLSNMTIRRLLQLADSKLIPEKYQLHVASILNNDETTNSAPVAPKANNFVVNEDMISQLIRDAKKADDTDKVRQDLDKKLKKESFHATILNSIKTLREFAFSKGASRKKLIAIGALIYFINPFDLLPDTLPVVGYLDDIGVMTLAIQQIMAPSKKSDS
jgi:uncharacterized membrane protein YkvA (DUF1232 family)